MTTVPFLTSYDPPASVEGTLDPLGLYQIADQLATRLVPAVRERMQRVRFLTAMAVSALVTEPIEMDPGETGPPPFLVWEWLVVEALVRHAGDDAELWGVPGTLVARRALATHGYLDARSYLKTPRIFGFHGVYKRLAMHLGLVDVHLGPGPACESLVDAWARDLGHGGLEGARPLLDRWRSAVQRSMNQTPPRTHPAWNSDGWAELAEAMMPHRAGRRERRVLRNLLHAADDRSLGAFGAIWALQDTFDDETFSEERLHDRLQETAPQYATLLEAVRAYERFSRAMQDGFDLLRAGAAGPDARGFALAEVAKDEAFCAAVAGLDGHFAQARQRLGAVDLAMENLFDERFGAFSEPLTPGECARRLCDHHEAIQKHKSAAGKRPWFDRLAPERIYMRHRFRIARPEPQPDRYVHDDRGYPIRRFYFDLT